MIWHYANEGRAVRAHRRAPRGAGLACLALVGLLAPACAPGGRGADAYFQRISGRDAVESHLAGEALAQRKYSMRRIRRDMASFRQTLEQLQRHGKTNGIRRFEGFAKPFIEVRVDPLIAPESAGWHPELRPFRAELLLSKAVLLHQMGERRGVRATIEALEQDFASMSSMLVLYPTGEAVTLEQSIALLRAQTGEI
jgi:hypothetical protein